MTHPIEIESYRLLTQKVDLTRFTGRTRSVAERVLHATADPELASSLVVDDAAVSAGVEAIRSGCPIVCDVEMVRAGISGAAAHCYLSVARAAQVEGPESGPTLSARAMGLAAAAHPRGAVVVVGCAPTALTEAIRLHGAGTFEPALVIGLPVGYVGAADAKVALRRSTLASISNVGDRGGSAAAAAAFNALHRLAFPESCAGTGGSSPGPAASHSSPEGP